MLMLTINYPYGSDPEELVDMPMPSLRAALAVLTDEAETGNMTSFVLVGASEPVKRI